MTSIRRAVIDVGTNSVKLLVVEVEGPQVRPILEESTQTRLGQGFYPKRILQTGPVAETSKAIANFAIKANQLGAGQPRIIATSAVREAQNQNELKAAVTQACGLLIRVISGQDEANYVFQGVTTEPRFAMEPLLLLDVGGGSAEFIVGHHAKACFAHSFPLGTVRLLELLKPSDCPGLVQLSDCRAWLRQFFQQEISPKLGPALEALPEAERAGLQLVGTGGTASILACMEAKLEAFDREKLEATQLTRERLHWQVEHLWELPISDRRKVVGLPANRADVILTGSAIYEALMDCYDFQRLRVSTRGLRFAVALED
jgi:exopolyphosphatase/guanosine-5'-triphosphate,3'-diphosphate pyrophosphatase